MTQYKIVTDEDGKVTLVPFEVGESGGGGSSGGSGVASIPSKLIADSTYTVVESDKSKVLYFYSGSATTVTISDGLSDGFWFYAVAGGADVTLAQATGGVMGDLIAGRSAIVSLIASGQGYPDDTYLSVQYLGIGEAGGGGGGGASTPTFRWYNDCGNSNNSIAMASPSWDNSVQPGGYNMVTTTNSICYTSAYYGDDYNNSLMFTGGWSQGSTAYWSWNPYIGVFSDPGSIKVHVGDATNQPGQTHNALGSYGFYTDQWGGKIYAFTYDGTTETRVEVQGLLPASVNPGRMAVYTAVYTPDTDVKFYAGGTLLTTITTNLPPSAGEWLGSIGGIAQTLGNTQINLRLGNYGIDINVT